MNLLSVAINEFETESIGKTNHNTVMEERIHANQPPD